MTLRNRPWLITILACLTLFLLLAFIKFTQIRAAIAFGESFPEPSETVHSQLTASSFWQPTVSTIGEIRASRELDLRTEINGMIATVGFESGAYVNKGQVLLQLDIAEEQAQLAALEPQIELAKKDVKRLSGAAKSRSVSQQLADQAQSNLAVLKAQAVSIREIIANKTVTAPFDGRTGLHDFEAGEVITAGTLVTRLIGGLGVLWVDFSMPQQYANFTVGQQVSVSTMQDLAVTHAAKVIAVEPNISRTSRSLSARAELQSDNNALKPGAVVNVSAPVGAQREVVRLPSTAIRVDAFGSFVYALKPDAKQALRAYRQPVTVLAKQGSDSLLAADIGVGISVATLGSFKLRDGLLTYVAATEQNLEADNDDGKQAYTETAESTQSSTASVSETEAVLDEADTTDIQPNLDPTQTSDESLELDNE